VVPSKKRAVILGEPICWRCWATDLSPEGTRKSGSLEKSAAVPLRTRFPWLPLRANGTPGADEGKLVPSKKVWHLRVGPDSWISV